MPATDNLLTVAEKFDLFALLPFGATRLAMILANGSSVRNRMARFGGRPMRIRT